MQRIRAFAMALVMVLSLAACGSGSAPAPEEEVPASKEETPVQEETPAPEDEDGKSEEAGDSAPEPEEEPAPEPQPLPEGPPVYTFENGVLTCSGGGEVTMDGWLDTVKTVLFETDNYKAMYEVKKVVVEKGITSLGAKAFGGFSHNTCKNLTEISLPDTLTSIGEEAFRGTALTSADIPDSVTEIGEGAFNNCESLTSVKLPSGLKEIPRVLFASCTNLTNVQIPEGLTRIEEYAFERSGLTELVIPESVTAIGGGFIQDCPITSITFPASLTEWGGNINYSSYNLMEVTFLCETTMDNVESLLEGFIQIAWIHPITIHAPAGSVVEGYVNRQIENAKNEGYGDRYQLTFSPI